MKFGTKYQGALIIVAEKIRMKISYTLDNVKIIQVYIMTYI